MKTKLLVIIALLVSFTFLTSSALAEETSLDLLTPLEFEVKRSELVENISPILSAFREEWRLSMKMHEYNKTSPALNTKVCDEIVLPLLESSSVFRDFYKEQGYGAATTAEALYSVIEKMGPAHPSYYMANRLLDTVGILAYEKGLYKQLMTEVLNIRIIKTINPELLTSL